MIQNDRHRYGVYLTPYAPKKAHQHFTLGAGQTLNISHGPSECGYDVRLGKAVTLIQGYTTLAVTLEHVAMPVNLAATVATKSTWARLGLCLNTAPIDPGFQGHITIEITWSPLWRGWWEHLKSIFAPRTMTIPAGVGLGTLVFQPLVVPGNYSGKYQNQGAAPQHAK